MENLIRQSFCRIGDLHSHVMRGDYDILSPTGEIILPGIWASVIKPGWVVELCFSPAVDHERRQDGSLACLSSHAYDESADPLACQAKPIGKINSVRTQRRSSVVTWLAKRKTTSGIAS